jgi:hypothetical protein
MGNLAKSKQKRERIKENVDAKKQSTLDDISFQFNLTRTREAIRSIKEIVINLIKYEIKEDELGLKVEFNLIPSKASFSKINLDLYFQDQLINSTTLCMPQSPLLSDSLEFPQILDMKGIASGNYPVRVEMYELWDSNEKLSFTAKEIFIEYVPQFKESRLVKVPTVKSVAGTDLTVVSSAAQSIYQELDEEKKKEAMSKRDEW